MRANMIRTIVASNPVPIECAPPPERGPLRSLLLVVLLSVSAAACLNLDDVASLTVLADRARQTLPPVVKDWPVSCERFNSLVRDIPGNERPPTMQPRDCAPYATLADHVLEDQRVLIAYFDALGKLASNDLFTFHTAIDTNVTAIGTLGASPNVASAATAAEKIGKVLADAITHGYRSHEVNSLIINNDDAVRTLTGALQAIATKDYAIVLANEADATTAFYESPLAAASASGSERLVRIVVQRQYARDRSALASRKTAAEQYGKAMDTLAALHAKLKDEIARKASLKEMAAAIGPYVSGVADAIGAIKQEIP